MWATKNHGNTDGFKTGFQWAKYIVQKISSAQSLKYFNKNFFCSQVIAIHFQTIFSSKRQRSPDGFASFFQIRSYFTATFLFSSTALQTFLCTSWRGGRWRKARLFCLGKSLYSCSKSERVHSPNLTSSLIQKEYSIIAASHFSGQIIWLFRFPDGIWPLHTAGFLCLKRSEGYITISGDQAAGWLL